MLDIADETERVRSHLFASPTRATMLDAIAGLSRAGFREGAISAPVGELSERLVANMLGGAISRRQNSGWDLLDSSGRMVEVKSRIATVQNCSSRQFNFSKTSSRADYAYCLTWTIDNGSPLLDRVICLQMGFLIEHEEKPADVKHCARTTHGRLGQLLARYGGIVPLSMI